MVVGYTIFGNIHIEKCYSDVSKIDLSSTKKTWQEPSQAFISVEPATTFTVVIKVTRDPLRHLRRSDSTSSSAPMIKDKCDKYSTCTPTSFSVKNMKG